MITGASSGIGWEFAKVFAGAGYDLVIVARSEVKLIRLKEEIVAENEAKVMIIIKDLTAENAGVEIKHILDDAGIVVDCLVNNAGFGDYGEFYKLDLSRALDMIKLNVSVLTELTHLFLQGMVERGDGYVINVASTSAFQPGPLMAVYFATKAFVLHFSEAINNELKGEGVGVTALCPGATSSAFFNVAQMNESKLVKRLLPTPKEVAICGYKAMLKRKPVVIHGLFNKIQTFMVRFGSRGLIVNLTRHVMGK